MEGKSGWEGKSEWERQEWMYGRVLVSEPVINKWLEVRNVICFCICN